MATLHPILFPDLLDSIIVSIIKAISSKVRANEWNICKAWCQWVVLALESFRLGFNYTNLLYYCLAKIGLSVAFGHSVEPHQPVTCVRIISQAKGRYACKINF